MKKTYDRRLSTCIFCDEPVTADQKKFNLALERPYRIDLLVHRTCYNEHKNSLREFLIDNLKAYLDKYGDGKNGKTRKSQEL